jgi:hypothetical protein
MGILIPIRNPFAVVERIDDFMSGGVSGGTIGALGWTSLGNTPGVSVQPGVANHPGIIRRDTGTTATTIATLYLGNSVANGPILGTDMFDVTFIVRVNQADSDTKVRVGLSSRADQDVVADGAYFERLYADTNWFALSRAASVQGSRVDTGVAMGTGWVVMRVRRIGAGSVGFRIGATVDAMLAATEIVIASNTPGIVQQPFIHIQNQAAASKTMDIDYADIKVLGLTR